jgi:predicted amidohydrolase
MRLAAIQHDIAWEDAPATHARVAPRIASAAAAGARLIVLSEMFATGFSMRPERVAEDEGTGASERFLQRQAAEHGVHLVASIAQRGADGAYRNNALLVGPEGTLARYAKIHPFSYSGEHEHYTAGERFVTATVEGVRITLFVCYDLRFADEFWAVAEHTDLYVVPANWPAARVEHWRTLLRARAIENQAYVLGVNRVGRGGRLDYPGASALVDPAGRVLFEAGSGEDVLNGEVDAGVVAGVRAEFPFLADRRRDFPVEEPVHAKIGG